MDKSDLEQSTFTSKVPARLVTQVMRRGTAIAAVGASLMIYGGTALGPSALKVWGIPLIVISLLLITLGLRPHRRLSRLRTNPDTIFCAEDHLVYARHGRPMLQIPYTTISRVELTPRGVMIQIGDRQLEFPFFDDSLKARLDNVVHLQ